MTRRLFASEGTPRPSPEASMAERHRSRERSASHLSPGRCWQHMYTIYTVKGAPLTEMCSLASPSPGTTAATSPGSPCAALGLRTLRIPTPLHPCMPTPLYPYIPVSLHPYIPVSLHPYTPVSLHPCIPPSLHPPGPPSLPRALQPYLLSAAPPPSAPGQLRLYRPGRASPPAPPRPGPEHTRAPNTAGEGESQKDRGKKPRGKTRREEQGLGRKKGERGKGKNGLERKKKTNKKRQT